MSEIKKPESTLDCTPQDRVVRKPELKQIVGVSSVTIWRWEREGIFPKRRQLRDGGSVGWLLSEVQEWMQNRQSVCGGQQ